MVRVSLDHVGHSLSERTRKSVEELHKEILTSRRGIETARHIDTQTAMFRAKTLLGTHSELLL